MTPTHSLIADPLLEAIRNFKNTNPEPGSVLEFYEAVRQAQQETKSLFHTDLPGLDIEHCRTRISRGQPFLKAENIKIDGDLFHNLFNRIIQISRRQIPGNIVSLLPGNKGRWHDILPAAFLEDKALLEQAATELGIDSDILTFLTYHTLSPFLERYAEMLRKYIDDSAWSKGCCPVCGGEPLMGKLDKETGKKILCCYLCRTEWMFKRLECFFCGNSDQEKLRFFFDGDDPAYRVEVCDLCKTYLKTVDARKTHKEIFLSLENLVTFHLDLVAVNEGFQKETARLFGF